MKKWGIRQVGRFNKRGESFCGVECGEQVWDKVTSPGKISKLLKRSELAIPAIQDSYRGVASGW